MMPKCRKEYFRTENLIEISERFYPKFYSEFIKSFDSEESLKVSIKLLFDNVNDIYMECVDPDPYDEEWWFNYHDLIRDLGLHYGVYKNKEEYDKDYFDDKYIYRLKTNYPKLYEKLKKKCLTDKQIYDDGFISFENNKNKWDTSKLAKKYKLYNFLRKKYVIFDINDFIEYSFKFYPKFYKEFVLKFKNVDLVENEVKSKIDVEDYEYKKHCGKDTVGINYYKIVRELGIEYHIYKDQKEMRKDYSMLRSN